MKGGRLLIFDTMDALRAKLGKREYQVFFQSDEKLDYEYTNGHYCGYCNCILDTSTARR